MSNDIVLAVETSTKACSVSLKYNGIFYTEFEIAPQQHANKMLKMVQAVLNKAKLKGQDITVLALCEGPGAFTGVRIAAGVIQGLAYGWNCPVVSVSSLEALAWEVLKDNPNHTVIACLDARMQEIYLQECSCNKGNLVSNPPLILAEQAALKITNSIENAIGTGDIEQEFPNVVASFVQWNPAFPSAEAVAEIASQRIGEAKLVLNELPLPLYLRNNVAEKSKKIIAKVKNEKS